jgi:hypothetical protein
VRASCDSVGAGGVGPCVLFMKQDPLLRVVVRF